jgi:hypothetical protein
MTDDEDKRNMRIMLIASGVIALFIVGLILTNRRTDPSPQSRYGYE